MGVDVSGRRVGVDVSGIVVKWLSHRCMLTVEALGFQGSKCKEGLLPYTHPSFLMVIEWFRRRLG